MTSGQNSPTTRRIVFFGTEEFSAASLRALLLAGFDVAAVITKPDSKKGRGHTLAPPTVKIIAKDHNIPVWQPNKLSEVTDIITDLQPATGVLVSFGKIIPQTIIDLFTPGIINVHPSRLPQYRGPSPIESALLNGDTETGVTLMSLSAQMDAGPIYGYTPVELVGTETASELYDTLGDVGARLLVQLLPAIISGDVVAAPQDDTQATYCQMIQKQDGVIDWNTPATQIERHVRAYEAWPQSRTTLNGIDVIITQAHPLPLLSGVPGTFEIIDETPPAIAVHTSDGSLCIDRLKPIGKKEMPVQAFLTGYKNQLQ